MTRWPAALCIVSLGLLLAAATPGQAGTARQTALGGDPGYFADTADILRWYTIGGDDADQAIFEFGDLIHGDDDAQTDPGLIGHGGGLHLRPTKDGRWGTMALYFRDHLPHGGTDGAFSGVWTRRFGPIQAGVGGHLSTFHDFRAGTEIGDRSEGLYSHRIGLGVAGDPCAALRLEAAGEIVNTQTRSQGSIYSLTPTNDWTTFGIRLRGFIDVAPTVTVVPLGDYYRDRRGTYAEILAAPADLDAEITCLGAALNIRTDPRTLVIVGGEYRVGHENMSLRQTETRESEWDVSLREFYQIRGRAGVENELFPWLTVRAAARYLRHHEAINRMAAGDPVRSENIFVEAVSTPLALGVGLRYRRMTMDFSYNDAPPLNPGLGSEGLFSGDREGTSALTLGIEF